MLSTILGFIIWAIIGALPGFYATYFKKYNPLIGIVVGAIVGIVVGEFGIRTGIVSTQGSGVVIIFGLGIAAALLLPFDDYMDNQVSIRGRISYLAYALTIPTALIVLGIVIFPLIWNLIFSVRDIQTSDLLGIEIFDLSELTLENFQAQAGVRLDTVPCVRADDGSCLLDESGNIEFEDPRKYIEDYRGWRESGGINLGENRLAIGNRNRDFFPMLGRTFLYTLASSTTAILFGLVAALLVKDAFPGRSLFRGFVLFPYIAPIISVAFVWQVLLRQNGIANAALGTDIPFLNTNDTWLGVSIPLWMVIFFQTWRYFPFAFLFLLARIQAIPEDMYEAAKVDGASPIERLWFITLPQLRAVFGTLFLLRFIWTFNKFDDIFLLTGVSSQTKVIPVAIFEALFSESNVGEASAIAVIMAVILACVLLVYFKFFLVEEA